MSTVTFNTTGANCETCCACTITDVEWEVIVNDPTPGGVNVAFTLYTSETHFVPSLPYAQVYYAAGSQSYGYPSYPYLGVVGKIAGAGTYVAYDFSMASVGNPEPTVSATFNMTITLSSGSTIFVTRTLNYSGTYVNTGYVDIELPCDWV